MSPLLLPAVAVAALGLWLALLLVRAGRARTAARAAYFDAATPLFDRVVAQHQPTGFPRLTAHRDRLAFDLQAIPDTLTFRKLPALWVMVSLPQPMPLAATLDLMARPSGNEPFTHFATLPQSLPPLPFLPSHVAIRSDNAPLAPPADLIARHARLFDDPQMKELLLPPKGVRLVILAEEADRGRYLLFRDAELGMHPLAPARLAPLLDALRALRDDILTLPEDQT